MPRLAFLIAALLLWAGQAQAQTAPAQPAGVQAAPPTAADSAPATVASLSAAINQADADLRAVQAAVRPTTTDDATLRAQIAAIPPIETSLAAALADLTPRLQNVALRLAQIGSPPPPPQTEAPEIADSRRQLTRIDQVLDADIKQARLLSVEAQQLSAALTARRQRLFSEQLWTLSRSVLSPSLWIDFAAAIPKDAGKLHRALGEEGDQFAEAAAQPGAVPLWIVGLIAAILLLGPARLLLDRLAVRQMAKAGADTPLRRSGLALGLAVTSGATPLVAGLIVRGVLLDESALTAPFERLIELTIRILVVALLLEGLGRAILAPGRPGWRMAPIADALVARLAPYPALIAFTAALAALVAGVNSVFGLSLPTSVASDCVTLLLELGAVAGGLAMLGAARHTHGEGSAGREQMRLPWVLTALAAWLTVIFALVAVLFGYLALASFLARQMIWIGLILALLFVSIAFTDELFPALLAPERTIGRFARIGIGLSPGALEPISVLLSGLSRLVLLLLAWMAILQPFGAASDLYGSLTSSALNFKLGQVTVSPGVVLGAIAVFVAGLAITRAIRQWVESRYLPKTRMDIGARTSLTLAISYLGGLTAVVVACAYLGLSLERITLLASALSVGIGFGLQAIISNFISGLILLAERPIKVGDWIAVGDQEGDVKRVNVRATEIELFDRSKLIIPNSDLISKPVRNITHPGALGRVALVLQIDAGADPAAVHDVIGESFAAHPDVLTDPKAGVYMTNVKDGALDFLAIAFVATPRDVFRVKSELLYAMIPALKARGIAFASSSPTVVVNAPPAGGGPVRAEGEADSA